MSMNIRNKVVGTAFAISAAFTPPVFADDAPASANFNKAVSSPVLVSVPTQRKYSVKIVDYSDKSRRATEFWAAKASVKSGKMVVLYGGDDKELQRPVQEGASDFKDAGGEILGIVVAQYDPNVKVKNRDSFAIYVDGMRIVGGRNPTKFNASDVETLLTNVTMQLAQRDNTLALNQP